MTKTIQNPVQHFAADDTKKRYNKALSAVHRTGIAPREPEYRISLFEGAIVMGFCFIADLVEFIIGLFIVTESAVVIIDAVIGLIMCAWLALYHKVPFVSHWQRYASLLVAFIGEAIPYVDVCSFWFFDAWYIVSSIRNEDRQMHQQLMQTVKAEQQEQERQEWVANYEQQQAAQAQETQEEQQEENEERQEGEQENEQTVTGQSATRQDNGGVGRINSPQPAGKPAGNGGIIK